MPLCRQTGADSLNLLRSFLGAAEPCHFSDGAMDRPYSPWRSFEGYFLEKQKRRLPFPFGGGSRHALSDQGKQDFSCRKQHKRRNQENQNKGVHAFLPAHCQNHRISCRRKDHGNPAKQVGSLSEEQIPEHPGKAYHQQERNGGFYDMEERGI